MTNKCVQTIICLLLAILSSNAQSIIIRNDLGKVVNGDTLIAFPKAPQKPPLVEITCKLYPKNNSSRSIELLVKKTEIILGANVEHSFCFGTLCYTPSVFVASNSNFVDRIDSTFKGVYRYDPSLHTPRKDLVAYTFYNKNNIADSAIVYVEYNTIDALGLETFENPHNNNSFLKIYPNPTQSIVNISAHQQIQRIELFDLFGKKIKTFSVMEKTYSVEVESLIRGSYVLKIYFKENSSVIKFYKE